MGDDQATIVRFYKKRIEPFIAIFILAFLITYCVLLIKDNSLKKEISENCGFEKDDYYCYCEKQMVDNFMLKHNAEELINVSLDWGNIEESNN